MQIQGLFPTALAASQLNCNTQQLIDYAHTLEAASPGAARAGGWQSGALDFNAPELAALLNEVANSVQGLAHHLWNFKPEFTLALDNGWINNNRSEAALNNNWSHLHGGHFVSLVYYAQVPEQSGNLILEPAHQFLDYCVPEQILDELTPWNAQRHHHTPQTGQLIAFPSWIRHSAQPNTTGKERISYAFNASIARAQQARSA